MTPGKFRQGQPPEQSMLAVLRSTLGCLAILHVVGSALIQGLPP